MSSTEVTPASIRMAAMNYLSMREHSAKELYTKLAKKFEQTDWIVASIEKLKSDGLQSDQRFTEAFVAMRLRQGKGSVVIRLELTEKGISDTLISKYLVNPEQETDWNALALKAYRKKFGNIAISDLKDKAKRIRFLTARGFSSANIQYVFRQSVFESD